MRYWIAMNATAGHSGLQRAVLTDFEGGRSAAPELSVLLEQVRAGNADARALERLAVMF